MTELTDKMRTCAAHLITASIVANPAAIDDAAALLNEAADLLEAAPASLGEPMEIIEPPPPGFAIDRTPSAIWTDNQLPQASPRRASVCPRCDSHAGKTVVKVSKVVMLQCPVCDHTWKY